MGSMQKHKHVVTAISLGIGCVGGLIALQLGFGSEQLVGQQVGQNLTVSVNDPRPLAKAIETIEQQYGWVITYEDPLYEYAAEIEDVAALVRKDGDLSKKVLIPRGGAFFFSYAVTGEPADPVGLLRELLASYESTGHPGRFSFGQTGNVFHVFPAARKNKNGEQIEQDSVLETRISLPAAERTAEGMVRAVLQSVSQATGINSVLGISPINLLRGVRTSEGVVNEAARDVLVRTLEATQRQTSWQLFYGPGSKMYVFNVHLVAGPAPTGQ